MRDNNVVDDVLQETFARAYASRRSFDLARPLWPWLAAIAARLCIDLWRSATPSVGAALLPVELLRGTWTAEDEYHRIEVRCGLTSALGRLTERQRRLLILQVEGHTYEAIAERERMTLEAVRSAIARARRRLRETLPDGDL